MSDLHLPGAARPWEAAGVALGHAPRMASALQIMLEGPLGGAAFNNEFGRPNLAGYFRTFCLEVDGAAPGTREVRGYHKPIMLAGGYGHLPAGQEHKLGIGPGARLVVLGGPALLIGLGGGAASSMATGASAEDLDFASVQRANPELQRRCQEVIDRCWALGADNPIRSIHDVGAGGLSNAFPELVADAGRGGRLALRAIPSGEPGLSPMEIWCNEAQERYVLAIDPADLARFGQICARERAPWADVGAATEEMVLSVEDALLGGAPIDLPLGVLFGKPPRMHRDAVTQHPLRVPVETAGLDIGEAAYRLMALPTVASKEFLITIGDRSVTGQVVRDQMVGPWQVPVADVAVTTTTFSGYCGEAMAVGERAPVALLSGAAAARLAVTEALTNLMAAPVGPLERVVLSANWMCAAGYPGEDAALYAAVRAVGEALCPALGINIPVGKDSMSMRAVWTGADGAERRVTAPLSLIVTAFAPVPDVRPTQTPQLRLDRGETALVVVDLGRGQGRLGGSALAQVYGQIGATPPDLDDPGLLRGLWQAMMHAHAEERILAWHDRSDGGLFVTLCEMAFAGRAALDLDLSALGDDPVRVLFAEEPGGVLQVPADDVAAVVALFAEAGLGADCVHVLAGPHAGSRIILRHGDRVLLDEARVDLHRAWGETSYRMQALRDDPVCAEEAYDALLDEDDPGTSPVVPFSMVPPERPVVPAAARPRVAILREQGINGHWEMAAAFHRAGFVAVDVHMSDVLEGRDDLTAYRGLAACGGFSYGDVLGAGGGWARSILQSARARAAFAAFFARPDTFTLGVCNGCQMLSQLQDLIPGAEGWPRFVRNRSEQFEARVCSLEIADSPSVLLRGMAGARLPVAVAHGEGRARFRDAAHQRSARVAARYVDSRGYITERYPANPNGSPQGVTAFTTPDGRATILMPHPERVFRAISHSWRPDTWTDDGPWMKLFHNAYDWVMATP